MYRLILFLLLPACAAAAPPNLLLITIDTLRADHLGAYGRKDARTPNLDALAAKSVLFEQAICAAPLTLPSHTSLLTGRYPYHHGVRDNAGRVPEKETTLAEILKQQRYHTYAAVGGFPLDHRFGLDQGFDIYNDEFPHRPGRPLDFGSERTADAVVDAVSRFKAAAPFFVWVHFYDPHAPYRNGGYPGEIAFVDIQVGHLLKLLPLQNTIIAVAGDHGESLGEHGEWTHRIFVYDSTMRVPFFISAPGLTPVRVQPQARLIDFLPTVLSLMKIPANGSWDGAVLPANAGRPAVLESMFPQLQLGWKSLIGVRTGEWKYIEAPRSELYDLRSDPGEADNLFAKRQDIARKLKSLLPQISGAAPAKVDPETAERLAALGYVSGGGAGGGSGADPKDRIRVWNEIERAVDLEESDAPRAIEVLENARKADARNPMILNMLAERYAESGKLKEADQVLTGILKRDPQNTLALARMAHLQLRMNRATEARRTAETLLRLEPNSVEAQIVAAQACLALNDAACAGPHLEQALKVDPTDHETRNDLGNLYLQQQKTAAAVREFNAVLQSDPENLQALNGLATEAYLGKRYGECETMLKKAIRIRPDDTQTRMNLALLYSRTDRVAQAVELYRQILANPNTPSDWKAEAASRLKELNP